ncbi:MAG: hypothetical protein BWZ09_02589 [Alphaproteobacteria bacterium ADurb.BinA305]|nr:MAG: hypothetical protein BWZ09_02589 [Alphaproteobacteria bacterium ADurb.BinA305]
MSPSWRHTSAATSKPHGSSTLQTPAEARPIVFTRNSHHDHGGLEPYRRHRRRRLGRGSAHRRAGSGDRRRQRADRGEGGALRRHLGHLRRRAVDTRQPPDARGRDAGQRRGGNAVPAGAHRHGRGARGGACLRRAGAGDAALSRGADARALRVDAALRRLLPGARGREARRSLDRSAALRRAPARRGVPAHAALARADHGHGADGLHQPRGRRAPEQGAGLAEGRRRARAALFQRFPLALALEALASPHHGQCADRPPAPLAARSQGAAVAANPGHGAGARGRPGERRGRHARGQALSHPRAEGRDHRRGRFRAQPADARALPAGPDARRVVGGEPAQHR